MVIFSEFHLSAYSGTIDINVICQFCNKSHILPGFTLIPHKSNVIKMDIMDTYFFCRCLIPPDHGDRDISVQHLDIIKIDICYLTYFAKCFTIHYDDLISIPYIPFYHSFSTIVCTSIPKVPFNRLSNRTQRNQVTVPWKDGIKQLLDRLKAVDYITSHTERTATQQNDGSRQDEKSNRSVYIVRIKVLK